MEEVGHVWRSTSAPLSYKANRRIIMKTARLLVHASEYYE